MDDSNPHELIPILFSLKSQVSDYFYHIDNEINLPRKRQISGTDQITGKIKWY